jgi:hypothetical protein
MHRFGQKLLVSDTCYSLLGSVIDPALKYEHTVPHLCAFFLAQRWETDTSPLGPVQ